MEVRTEEALNLIERCFSDTELLMPKQGKSVGMKQKKLARKLFGKENMLTSSRL